MSKFKFGIDSMPFWRSWPGPSPKHDGPWPPYRPDTSGIVETPLGRLINGVHEAELIKVENKQREKLEQLEREHYADLAAVYRRLAEIKSPRLRAMVKSFLLPWNARR